MQADCKVIQGYQCKSKKSPEHECVRKPRQRPLLYHFALAEHFPRRTPSRGSSVAAPTKSGIRFRSSNDLDYRRKAPPEEQY